MKKLMILLVGLALGLTARSQEDSAADLELEAMKYAQMGSLNGGYDLNKAIKGLKQLSDKIPDSYYIKTVLPSYRSVRNAIKQIDISIDLKKQPKPGGYAEIIVDLTNNSKKVVDHLVLWYEFKDADGKVLLKPGGDLPQPYSSMMDGPLKPGDKREMRVWLNKGVPRAVTGNELELVNKAKSATIEIKWLNVLE